MISSKYKILLDDLQIALTDLEFGDPSMGVVFGNMLFTSDNFNYTYILKYCYQNKIYLPDSYLDDGYFTTSEIRNLTVTNDITGVKVVGLFSYLECSKNDDCRIYICGITQPLYAKEFPQHMTSNLGYL